MKRIRGRRRQRERGWYLAGAVLATLLALGLLGSLQGRPAGAAAGKAKIPPAAHAAGAGREEGSDSSWPLTLVNRWNPVPEGHEVELVAVEGGEQVDARLYGPLTEMLEAAREGNLGQLPIVVSGYRTQEEQRKIYEDRMAQYLEQGYSEQEAREETQRWVAVPGYSEHQLGAAVDINGATYDVYLWLQENSYRYGFIFRYPGDKTGITGTAEEVWHYRYVGVEAATEIHERGICLEEYLQERGGQAGGLVCLLAGRAGGR